MREQNHLSKMPWQASASAEPALPASTALSTALAWPFSKTLQGMSRRLPSASNPGCFPLSREGFPLASSLPVRVEPLDVQLWQFHSFRQVQVRVEQTQLRKSQSTC